MKKLLIIALILSLTGCKNDTEIKRQNESNINVFEEKEEPTYIPKEIVNEIHGEMNGEGLYEVIYEGEKTLSVDKRYMIDETALIFSFPIEIGEKGMSHLSGEFRYTHNRDNYILKLDKICIDFFYMGVGGENFFHITVKDNQIRYWLYSKGKAELVINKIWRFVPNE